MQSLFSKPGTHRIFSAAILALIFFSASAAKAQDCGGRGVPGNTTNAGTQFLVCFMQNETPDYDPAEIQNIYLASDTDANVTVTITCRNYPTFLKVIPLLPRGSAVVQVNGKAPILFPNSGIINTDEIIDSTVFNVVANGPITCYGLNIKQFTADAFIALPNSVALSDYMIMSYYSSTNQIAFNQASRPSEFCVAAFQDNTVIEVTCAAQTQTGIAAGVPTRYTLDSGTAMQFQALIADSADMTGSTVKVVSGGRIAVNGGHSRTEVPTGYVYPDGSGASRDHIADAMPPIADWGCSFIGKNFGRSAGDVMRVLALNNNTVVKINGKVWGAPLMSGKFRDTLIANSPVAVNNILAVESDAQHPLLVGMLAHTATSGSEKLGDPFLAIVPPLSQGFNDFTYFIVNDAKDFQPSQNFLTIVTEAGGIGKITITNPDGSTFTPPIGSYTTVTTPSQINNAQYAVATINQPTTGIHRIKGPTISPNSTTQGFSILAYGWGEVISYGYTAGAKFQPQQGIGCLAPPPGSGNPPPTITIRDFLNERVYFDSAKVSYTQNPKHNIVRLKKDISLETRSIEPIEEKTLELVTMNPGDDIIKGTIRIWYHSALWTDMNPVDFPFTIDPQTATAGVNGAATNMAATLENYPNPSAGTSTITFSIPSRAYAEVKIYDALGRMVRNVSSGILSDGWHAFSVYGLPPGSYTIELSALEIGVSEHRKMIVM